MNHRDRADDIHRQVLAAQNPEELRTNLDALLSLFAEGDEISAAIELCTDALRRADELNLTPDDSIRYATSLLRCLLKRGTVQEASPLVEDIMKRLEVPSISPVHSCDALCAAGLFAVMAGQHDRAETLLEQAARQAAASRDVRCLAHYHNALGHVLLRGRQFNSAVASYHTAAALYHLAGDEGRAARNKAQVASAHTLAGRFSGTCQ
jgi:tetratricopeptide (TPR) repeat protein